LAVRGTLGAAAFAYELRALWPGAPAPVRGALALGHVDRVGFAGALRDQLHRLARATGDDTAATEAASASQLPRVPDPRDVVRASILVLGVLATPIAYGSLRARRLLRVARSAGLRTLIGTACVGALGIALAAAEPANGPGVLLAAGGLAWGTLVAV